MSTACTMGSGDEQEAASKLPVNMSPGHGQKLRCRDLLPVIGVLAAVAATASCIMYSLPPMP